jgi:hypothetical protein
MATDLPHDPRVSRSTAAAFNGQVAKRRSARSRADARVLDLLDHTGWVPIACAIAALMTVALSGITWVTSPYWGHNPAAPAVHKGVIPKHLAPSAVADIISPNRIEIPKIHANAPIVPVGTSSDGELEIPLNPKIVGWWRYGAKPGATVGTAILAGHINYAGVTGEMAAIGQLNPGDKVYVFGKQNAQRRHEVRFTVTGVRTYHKTHLPYRQIFSQKSAGRIVIVTCGGPFDSSTGNYLDNIVVYATPDLGLVSPGIPGLKSHH